MGEELAEGVRRGGEAPRHAHAGGGELADHFPERSVLAADRFDIGHAQGFEGDDEAPFEMVHEKVLA
jgi:hypothetical protein